MKSRSISRYMAIGIALCAMLLPLTSQADVRWSIQLGHGLNISHDYYQPYRHYSRKQYHHHRYDDHRHHGWKSRHHYRDYRGYKARRYYHTPYPYGFIPRHR